MFSRAIVDIRAAQNELELKSQALAATLRYAQAVEHNDQLETFASKVHGAWWDLFWSLVGKYNDGFVVTHGEDGAVSSAAVGYPAWWLKAVSFDKTLDAPSTSFANLKHRMAVAEARMTDIDAARKKPVAAAQHW